MKTLPNILIVDDIPENLIFLEAILESKEANIISAQSGNDALEKSYGIELALAILDVHMPGMSGYELAKKINENRSEFKVPVMFLTAIYNDEMHAAKGYSCGAVDYLSKPVQRHIIISKVDVFLDLYNQKATIIRNATILKETSDELFRVNLALRKSEEKYRNYIESAPDGVFVADEKGRYIEVNESVCNITGYSREELQKMTVSDLLPEWNCEDGISQFSRITGRGTTEADFLFLHKNGTKGWWNVQAVKISESNILGFIREITLRKEMEETLKTQKIQREIQSSELNRAKQQAEFVAQKYNALYDFAPTGYLTLSYDKTILELNHSGALLLGKKRRTLIGNHFGHFVARGTLVVFNNFFENVFNNKSKQVCEVMLETGNNQPKYVHIEGMIEGGSKQCLLNIVDITGYKQIELTSKISEEKYKTILNSSPDGVFLINLKGIITEVSEIGVELLGADKRFELIGLHILHFVPSEEKKSIRLITEKTLNEGLSQNIELIIEKKNHTFLLGEISSTLIQDVDGKPLSFMIIIRDISQRKKMETKQIHADRMANLGQMAAGIAHEINQPLNIISLVLDKILFESAKTETIDIDFFKSKTDKIFENILRIRNIIDHVRAFSRSSDDYLFSDFDINKSIENATSMILEQFKHLEIALDLQLEQRLPSIVGNTFQFEQVIINLLANAKDAVLDKKNSQEDSFEMTIGIKTHLSDQKLVVEVTDNGIGILNEDKNKIMLPFYTTKEEGKGTGLGLTICYQIIKEMGGIIDVSSEEFGGTKVKIILDPQRRK
ncbi:MAG: PAS domain S-box protein [Prolixibacteraceae bacterium]